MIKNIIFLKILLSFCFNIYSQSIANISTKKITVGKNLINNKEILATEILFPERIEETYLDTFNNILSVQTRGTKNDGKYLKNNGDFFYYSLTDNKVKWSKVINYVNSSIEQIGGLIIQTKMNKSFKLNNTNGNPSWDILNTVNFVDSKSGIAIGYKNPTILETSFKKNKDILRGFYLSNGKPFWEREISREYGWNNIYRINDTSLIIIASGLHSVNIKTGKGWTVGLVTGEKDYKSTAVANVAGVILGALTGVYAVSTGYDVVTGIVSNAVFNDKAIYLAAKEKIISTDYNGKLNWSTILPSKLSSESSIFTVDSVIYIVNGGYASMVYRKLSFGKPYIAAYNKFSGLNYYLSEIKNTGEIKHYRNHKDTILVLSKNKISKHSLKTGKTISEKIFDEKKYGELDFIIGNEMYDYKDSVFNCLALSDSINHYIYTTNNKVLKLNFKLEFITELDANDLYYNFLERYDLKFLYKNNQTVILNKENRKITALPISTNSKIMNGKIIDIQKNKFLTIDLNTIISND